MHSSREGVKHAPFVPQRAPLRLPCQGCAPGVTPVVGPSLINTGALQDPSSPRPPPPLAAACGAPEGREAQAAPHVLARPGALAEAQRRTGRARPSSPALGHTWGGEFRWAAGAGRAGPGRGEQEQDREPPPGSMRPKTLGSPDLTLQGSSPVWRPGPGASPGLLMVPSPSDKGFLAYLLPTSRATHLHPAPPPRLLNRREFPS